MQFFILSQVINRANDTRPPEAIIAAGIITLSPIVPFEII